MEQEAGWHPVRRQFWLFLEQLCSKHSENLKGSQEVAAGTENGWLGTGGITPLPWYIIPILLTLNIATVFL